MLLTRIALTLFGLAVISSTASADVTVRMLHVDQSPQLSGFWKEIARRYMAEHPRR